MLSMLFLQLATAEPLTCSLSETAMINPDASKYYVRGDLVNLRRGPSTESKIKAEIRLGTEVQVGACEKEETIGGKEGCWHKVSLTDNNKKRKGYLFSTAITDCRIEGDFDADGVDEYVFYSLKNETELQLRIQDPNAKPSVFWGDVRLVPHFWRAELSVYPAEKAGQDLLMIGQGIEHYGYTSREDFYSFHPERGLKEALQTYEFSDSPAYSKQSAQFIPNGKVIFTQVGDEENEEATEEILCFEQGVYAVCPPEYKLYQRFRIIEEGNRAVIASNLAKDPDIEIPEAGRTIGLEEMNRAVAEITSMGPDGSYFQISSDEWWVLPAEGLPIQVNAVRYYHAIWSCMEDEDLYGVEFDIPDGVQALLVVHGPPPAVWYRSQPVEPEPTEEELQYEEEKKRIVAQMEAAVNKQYPEENPKVTAQKSDSGWLGLAIWCCPDPGKPLNEEGYLDEEYEYAVSVVLSTTGEITVGELFLERVYEEPEEIIQLDIDGDGKKEVFWLGECDVLNWTKEDGDRQLLWTKGGCCGC